jgi:hypothetical protein
LIVWNQFLYSVRDGREVWVSTYEYLVFSTPLVEEVIFSPMYIFGEFVKNRMAVAVWAYFWVFYSITLIYMSGCVWVPCWFCYYGFVVQSDFMYWGTSSIVFW